MSENFLRFVYVVSAAQVYCSLCSAFWFNHYLVTLS